MFDSEFFCTVIPSFSGILAILSLSPVLPDFLLLLLLKSILLYLGDLLVEKKRFRVPMAMTLLLELQTEFSHLEELSLTQLKEDLLTMMKFNYPNRKSFLALSKICLIDLKYF